MFTIKEYVYGFERIIHHLTPNQLAMLQIQYAAPSRTMTTPQLARAVGWSRFNPVNLHYGKMGQKLRDAIPAKPKGLDFFPAGWFVISEGRNGPEGFQWILRDEVARALEILEIVSWKTQLRFPGELDRNEVFVEGMAYSVRINAYERNPIARKACIQHYGAICQICQFDFMDTYGDAMDGYIHVHHLNPLSEIGKTYKVDPIKDLIPVCPNCHAVIHSNWNRPTYSIEEVKTMLRRVSR